MKIDQEIYRRAKDVTKGTRKLREYIATCVEAKICPKCGKYTLNLFKNNGGFDCECTNCTWRGTV